jgi:magnesium transporter
VTIIDNAIYVDGRRTDNPLSLEETFETLRERRGVAWIDMARPAPAEIREVAGEFELHHLAVEDAISAHQRAKLERYDDVWFIVTNTARYRDESEQVLLGELHLFAGPDFVVTIRHDDGPGLTAVRHRLEQDRELLRRGPMAIVYAVLDHVVDGYAPVVRGLQNDIDEIEDQLFDREPHVTRRIYELLREVIGFRRAAHSLVDMLQDLDGGPMAPADVELQRSLRDVHDHTLRHAAATDAFRTLLDSALTVHATLVTQEQNEEMRRLSVVSVSQGEQTKKISGWAAILFAPTLVAGVYGMNFDHMPELHWLLGYPFALGLMAAVGGTLYVWFRRSNWL